MPTPSTALVVPDGKIVDYVDGKFRADTPEEYVRQNIEKRLLNELRYPRELIAIEYGLKVGSSRTRADVVIFLEDRAEDQDGVGIVVECKKESVSPSDKKEGVSQLKSYMSACLNCEWGLWTNGKQREVWRKVLAEDGKRDFVEYSDIPVFNGNVDDLDRPTRASLKDAVGDNLLYAFKAAHNSIHVIDGFQKEQAFFELLKIIFCKIFDERNITKPLDFYVTSAERASGDGQLACKHRINAIFESVKDRYSQIFESSDEIKLNPRSLVRIVAEFQGYSFLNTNVDIKGRAYEEVVGSNLKGDRGQFFTPRNVMQMAVAMVDPTSSDRILDPACGTGGFLVTAMNNVLVDLERAWSEQVGKPKHEWSVDERRTFMEEVSQLAKTHFFGFDISPELVKATKMNMVMNNDGSGNILHSDSLLPPHEWSWEFRRELAAGLNVAPDGITSAKTLAFFDVIITNPPFGSKIVIKDRSVLEQFELARIWEKSKENPENWTMTDRLQAGVPPEQLFIERCLQYLRPGGRVAIVLPDSILGSPGLGYIRQWLLRQAKIIASIDMHQDTFQPHTGVQTSVLVMQKKTDEERRLDEERGLAPYNVFMAIVNRVGHDKRGNVTYKRDIHGNDILQRVEETTRIGDELITTESSSRIIDDETGDVADTFRLWKRKEGITW
jgi:type I restriction enzyme M protein